MISLHISRESLEIIELGLNELHGKLNVTNPTYDKYKELLELVHNTLHPEDFGVDHGICLGCEHYEKCKCGTHADGTGG